MQTPLARIILLLTAVSGTAAWAQPQQGDHWSREPVTQALIDSADAVTKQIYSSVVRVNGATGVYLGVYAGYPVFMTAHHVMPTQDACTGQDVGFYPSNHYTCEKLLGAWPDVDLSLFALSQLAAQDPALSGRGLKPGFDSDITQFEMLETMGHGSEQNPENLLTVDRGSDCYVANATNDFRFRDNTTWSMALGCNESAGDSGSPIVDRASGVLLGVVWGGHTDKDDDIANSAFLHQLALSNSPEIWEQLNYASPMPVVGAMFKYLLDTQQLDPETRAVLGALIVTPRAPGP